MPCINSGIGAVIYSWLAPQSVFNNQQHKESQFLGMVPKLMLFKPSHENTKNTKPGV